MAKPLVIHQTITDKLNYLYEHKSIPNLLFNGSSGSGKSTIIQNFIALIYNNDKNKINDFVMYVNCVHCKGIKFIREELKFFSKWNIDSNGGNIFKTIVLFNADKLTIDAQSALRRCIELFCHNTRFFITVEDKYKLLKPILSRFCEIYISQPEYKGEYINLYQYNNEQSYNQSTIVKAKHESLRKYIITFYNSYKIQPQIPYIITFANKLYNKSFSALDLIRIIKENKIGNKNNDNYNLIKYELLIQFNKIKKEVRNEKLLLFYLCLQLFNKNGIYS